MQMLPKEKQPVAGSEGAQYRKKQLAKQLPAHDQDPSKCHELSPKEVKEMEQFVKKYKNEALGVGDVKLPRDMNTQGPNKMYIPGGDRSTTTAVGAMEDKSAEHKRTQYVSKAVMTLAHLVYFTGSFHLNCGRLVGEVAFLCFQKGVDEGSKLSYNFSLGLF